MLAKMMWLPEEDSPMPRWALVSRWYYAHGCGLVPASGELGFSIAKRLGFLSSIDNWDVGDDQAHR